MGDRTGIEWTDATWNPVTGCSKVSQGCKFCYAERDFHRPYPGREFTDVRTHPDRLDQPLRWRKPRRIFVNSMSDLFHEKVPFEFIDRVYAVMALSPQHTFQILTKRPERVLAYAMQGQVVFDVEDQMDKLDLDTDHIDLCWPLPNVWLGVSVEDQATADERIPLLLQTPAAVRFVSYEPALGPVDFTAPLFPDEVDRRGSLIGGAPTPGEAWSRIAWIIAGGESGPQARPSHPDWFRSARDQCQAAGVPFFFKQWGEAIPVRAITGGENAAKNSLALTFDGTIVTPDCCSWTYEDVAIADNAVELTRVGKRAAGRLLDGREWSEFPAQSQECK